uniref:PX domain-containing protein n=1 Tax=Zooxanthella nutricula TaxID=1333877 RepID=A0A7S2JRL7_9DINO
MVQMGDGTAVHLKRRAAEVVAFGGAGLLCVRVAAARGVVGKKNNVNLFVRVSLGDKTKQTPRVPIKADDNSWVWRTPPFIFEVHDAKANVSLEVVDGADGDAAETPLGRFEVQAAQAQDKLGQGFQRRPLFNAGEDSGELEVEIRFEGEVPFSVEGMLQEAIAMLSGDANTSEPVQILDSELRCPSMHPITKHKKGLRWHQVLHKMDQRCSLCDDVIRPVDARWRCHHHCNFDVCEACHREVHGGFAAGSGPHPHFADLCLDLPGDAKFEAPRRGRSAGAVRRSPSVTSATRGLAGSRARGSSSGRIVRKANDGLPHSTSFGSTTALRQRFLPNTPDSYCSVDREPAKLDVLSAKLPADAVDRYDNTVFYGVDIVPEPGYEAWRVLRRYNDFSNLAERLGPHAKSFPDAPFPGKLLFTSTDAKLEERRVALEAWLQRVLARRPMPRLWLRPLHEFCHAGRSAEAGGFAPLPQSWGTSVIL